MKIALFLSHGDSDEKLYDIERYPWMLDAEDYIQVSDIVDVDFEMISDEKTLNRRIAVLDKKIEAVMSTAHMAIQELQQEKQELLSITHQEN